MAKGGLASTGRRDADQSTPMACRPAYQPQFPQTRCGRLVALQRGQALRAGRPKVQAAALRLRPLALEVFFLGTAIVGSSEASEVGAVHPTAGERPEAVDPLRTTRRG